MVPPMMVTSTTVLTPDLLRVPMKWVFSTVKVTTAVSPALMVVLSSVMVAMGLSFQWDVDCAGAPHSGRRAGVRAGAPHPGGRAAAGAFSFGGRGGMQGFDLVSFASGGQQEARVSAM